MNFRPFGNNILVQPEDKKKIIGETSKYYLFGKVLGVGEDVKKIKVGDTIGYTLWGLCEIQEADGTKHYFIQENSDFILGILNED